MSDKMADNMTENNSSSESSVSNISIGIDLGTISCRVGVWQQNNVEIIKSDYGNRSVASAVAFTGEQRLIGDEAMLQAASNPHNAVINVKRIIGRRFSDASAQSDMTMFSCNVVKKEGEQPSFRVTFKGEEMALSGADHGIASLRGEICRRELHCG